MRGKLRVAGLGLATIGLTGAVSVVPAAIGTPDAVGAQVEAEQPGDMGRWDSQVDLPLVPVSGSILPDGQVLMWSGTARDDFTSPDGRTFTMTYDPDNGQIEDRVVDTGHSMFCPGTAQLPDGRVLVNGGSNAAETSIYNPATNNWESADDMNIPRGYQGTTPLADGSVLTLGGSWSGGLGNKDAEIWTNSAGWQRLPGVQAEPFTGPDPTGVYRADNHLWLFAWTDDRVFHAGPTRGMHWIDTTGDGSVSNAGVRGNDPYAMNGNAVMYEPGKILTVGGAAAYSNDSGDPANFATTNATVIDITGSSVTSRTVAPMETARAFHNSVLLPSGEVVVLGGQPNPLPFQDTDAAMEPEIWDPATETFRTLAPMAVPRTYHSIGMLLPDGRVLAAGGGLCGSCDTNHPDLEIFTPPYLLNPDGSDAIRPVIVSAPSTADLGSTIEVSTNSFVSEFALVRTSSTTHSVNNDQRRIPLTPTQVTQVNGNNIYRMQVPSERGLALPGNYMLFAMNAQGVPSESAMVNVTTDVAEVSGDASGSVVNETGAPAAGAYIDLFTANADGSRNTWLATATTASDGTWSIPAEPGNYVLTFVAPAGSTFVSGSRWEERPLSIASGQVVTGLDATVSGGVGGDETMSGRVRAEDGSAVGGVGIDLFVANADGSRGNYIATATTAADGTWSLPVEPGCYVLTFVAPPGETFINGSQWYQPNRCVGAGESYDGFTAIISGGSGDSSLGGTVTAADGSPASGVDIDLFVASADGSRGSYLAATRTGSDGSWTLPVEPGCYVLTFTAPFGESFSNGSRWYQPSRCADPGEIVGGLDATLS